MMWMFINKKHHYILILFTGVLVVSVFDGVIRSDDWGVDESPVVVSPEVQDIKLFAKWSADDVQVSDISLTVSVTFYIKIITFRTS